MIVESPTWLFNRSRLDEHKRAAKWLWHDNGCRMIQPLYTLIVTYRPFYQAEEPLLDQLEENHEIHPQESLTIPQVFATKGLRKPLMIVALAMITQQLSGK